MAVKIISENGYNFAGKIIKKDQLLTGATPKAEALLIKNGVAAPLFEIKPEVEEDEEQ